MTKWSHSPLAEVLNFDGPIEDAFFTTFNFSPAYFDRFVLHHLRNAGARVSILADAAMANFDPYKPSKAGQTYALGLIHHPRAFHPKLIVLLGADKTLVGVGSGNLTQSGWHSNDELWTFFESASRSTGISTGVASWLEDLSSSIALAPQIQRALMRVTSHLQTDAEQGSHRFVNNAQRGLLEQLPNGPVDELRLYAPFHDAGSRGLKKLLNHFQPGRVVLGYQSQCIADGESLSALQSEHPAFEVVRFNDEPYRHGKLIEWSVGSERWALTGSPNLTDVALGQSMSTGNVEIAVVSPVSESLFPETISEESASLGSLRLRVKPPGEDSDEQGERLPAISAAFVNVDVTEIYLSSPSDKSITVEASEASKPDLWRTVGEFSETQDVLRIVEPMSVGSWVRLRRGEILGMRVPVSTMRALEPARGARSHGYEPPDLSDLITDDDLARRFFNTYQEAVARRVKKSGTVASSGTRSAPVASASASTSWEEYLDQIGGRLGPQLSRYALGLPPLATSDSGPTGTPDFDDESIESSEGLVTDTAESVADEEEAETALSRERQTKEARRRIGKEIASVSAPSKNAKTDHPFEDDAEFHLLVARLSLDGIAGELWEQKEDWVAVVLDHLTWFATLELHEVQAVRQRQAAVAALLASAAHHNVPRIPPNPLASAIERGIENLAPRFEELRLEDLEAYADDTLHNSLGFCVDPGNVMEVIASLSAGDAFDQAVQTLVEFGSGVEAENLNPWLLLPKKVEAARALGLLALKQIADQSPCGVKIGPYSARTTFLWTEPLLAIVEPTNNGDVRRANVYRFPKGFGPESCESVEDLPKSESIILESMPEWKSIEEMFEIVES